ncbi:LRR domain containing protein [Parasponia andersonii]|uniref:LRR domain containing protein n=1 Tax=Parasponia andersonii TaxID=3476 RepID=A0A2P5AWD4_PARAD|nr:LRR domain containing protein [Parasponia andersonii]
MATNFMLIFKCLSQTFLLISLLICFPNSLVVCHHDETESPAQSPPLIPQLLTFADQRLAVVYPIIQTFKNIITSDPFGITKTWVGSDVCNYTGFYCDKPPDNLTATVVASIDFNGYQLAAPTLDGFIDQLPDLALFHANSNKFSGIISPKVASLRYLYELDLSNNNFLGPFPTALLTLPGLTFLDIRYNSFTGTVPPMIFIETLDALFLNNNNFIWTLPETLGSTTATFLVLANNKFTGPIPRSIGNASETLTEVLFLNNLLTGCIPYEVGLLRKAVVFDAENNLLTGPLPCSLRCLEKIEVLNFAGNLLYGKVPEVVCELGNLVNFSLSDNYFTYVGPQCRKLIEDGVLDVRNNCIHGLPDQRSLEECALFFLKPRSCLHPSWFTIIPCEVHAPQKRTSSKRYSKRKLVSYAALSRHRRLADYVL